MTYFAKKVALILLVSSSICLSAQEIREPEAATGIIKKPQVVGEQYMVVAANPYASRAGEKILANGGSAIDAAIAVQLVLTLVEPQSSGIGGGAFLLHWHKKKALLTTFDGRETAPMAASADLFLDKTGKPISWREAIVGGRSVGVPGVLAALKKAHDKYGKLPWASLFDDAIQLAEQGFIVSKRLEKLIQADLNPGLKQLSVINRYFYPNGKAIKAGDLLINKTLANTYKTLAREGVSAFYQGNIAKQIVSAVNQAEVAPGRLSLADMKNYQANEVPPVCAAYRDFSLCGMAPPSSGGVAVIQLLKQLSSFNLAQYKPSDWQSTHLFTQSSRLAFADRNYYMADPDFVSVPTQGLVDEQYLRQRSLNISLSKDMGKALPGKPPESKNQHQGHEYEQPSTTHLSIVDSEGNAVSMTSSIEMAFGSTVMVGGFILNNQLTDFSLAPTRQGKLVANRVEPGKRPRSSMAPMMVFNQDGSLKLLAGSPGGSRIINYVAQAMIAILDWQLPAQEAVSLPHVTNRNKVTTLEKGTAIVKLAEKLKALGHQVVIKDLNSGLHIIELSDGKLYGGADPRREGQVLAK